MKQITAIIRPNMLERVTHALHGLEHFPGFTLMRGKGESRGRAPGHAYHATEWNLDEHDRVVLLTLCSDELAPLVVETIRSAARTGRPGDGLISVAEVADIVRIRTDEHGATAV